MRVIIRSGQDKAGSALLAAKFAKSTDSARDVSVIATSTGSLRADQRTHSFNQFPAHAVTQARAFARGSQNEQSVHTAGQDMRHQTFQCRRHPVDRGRPAAWPSGKSIPETVLEESIGRSL